MKYNIADHRRRSAYSTNNSTLLLIISDTITIKTSLDLVWICSILPFSFCSILPFSVFYFFFFFPLFLCHRSKSNSLVLTKWIHTENRQGFQFLNEFCSRNTLLQTIRETCGKASSSTRLREHQNKPIRFYLKILRLVDKPEFCDARLAGSRVQDICSMKPRFRNPNLLITYVLDWCVKLLAVLHISSAQGWSVDLSVEIATGRRRLIEMI